MNTLTLMCRLRLKTFLRAFTRKSPQRLRYVFSAVFGGIFSLAVFGLSSGGFGALRRLEGGAELVASALAAVYTAVTFALVFLGLATALYTMYLSKDLDILLSMPIKERTIFAYKFWETLLGNSTIFVIFALPALLAYGVATGASVSFYPTVLVVSALVLVIPTGLSVLLIMPLMRLIPANRAKEIVSALSILVGGAFYVATQLWLVRPNYTGGGRASPFQAFSGLAALNLPPGSWASEALEGAASLEWGRLLSGLVPLTALAIGVYAVCLGLAGRAYRTGLLAQSASGGRVHTSGGWIGRLLGWLPRDIRAVAARDLTLLSRDLQRLALMAWPAAMFVILFVVNRPRAANPGSVSSFLSLFPYLTASILAALVAFRGGAQSVSIEGRSYWFLAAAPLSPRRLLAGKWVAILCVGAAVALLGSLGVSIFSGFYLPGLLLGVAAGIVVSAIVSLYAVGISALFPRFDWENPNQATSPVIGALFLACLIGLGILTGLAVALVFFVSNFVPLWASVTVAVGLWIVFATVPGYAVFSAGAERLKRLDWEL